MLGLNGELISETLGVWQKGKHITSLTTRLLNHWRGASAVQDTSYCISLHHIALYNIYGVLISVSYKHSLTLSKLTHLIITGVKFKLPTTFLTSRRTRRFIFRAFELKLKLSLSQTCLAVPVNLSLGGKKKRKVFTICTSARFMR